MPAAPLLYLLVMGITRGICHCFQERDQSPVPVHTDLECTSFPQVEGDDGPGPARGGSPPFIQARLVWD